MMRYCRLTKLFILLVVVLAMTNCAKMTHFFRTAQSSYHTKHYEGVCESWSREARVHHGFEAEYIVVGTFKSKAFRRAYVDEFAAAYQLNSEEKERLLEDQLGKTGLSHEFQVALFVPEKKWEKIDKTESMWKLYLVNDKGERVKPIEVERVNGQNADIKHFYPYVTPWKTPYVVRFPYRLPETNRPLVDKETKAITLVVTSVLGAAHLTWELEQP